MNHGDGHYWAAGSFAAQCIEQGLQALARIPVTHLVSWSNGVQSIACAPPPFNAIRVTSDRKYVNCRKCIEAVLE